MAGRPFVRPVVMEMMVMANTVGQEDRTADKKRPIEPGVPRVEWLGWIRINRLWRQRVDLLRQAGRVHRDLPAAVGLLARLTDGLLLAPFNGDRCGELAASPGSKLRWDERRVRRAWGNWPAAGRQDRHQGDTQKGMRTSISRNEAET